MFRTMRRSIFLLSGLVLVSGCALNSPGQLNQKLADADKQCSSRTDWPNKVSIASCYDRMEEPVIAEKAPAALAAFNQFSERRRYLAEQADITNAKGIEQSAKYRASLAEAFAVLKAREPKLADSKSSLSKEWNGARAPSVCRQNSLSEQVSCIARILRPIWERNAPDTLAYYDEHQEQHLRFARDFDASGALE